MNYLPQLGPGVKGSRSHLLTPLRAVIDQCPSLAILLILSLGLAVGATGSVNAAAPSNDGYTSAKLITGGEGSIAGNNLEATQEVGEPLHGGNAGGKSVWYTWHCSSGGTVQFTLQDATFSYILGVYVGRTLESMTPITSGLNSSVSLTLAPGTVYRIVVDGLDGASGNFSLHWKQTFGADGGPDLVVPERLIQVKIVEQNFPANDCEVEERCTVLGQRRLLRFDMHTHNLGSEDLVFGSPVDSPMFQYAACHNHYHFEALATYRVLNVSNELVRLGNKFGFCLEDVVNVSAPAEAARKFTCDDQGISAGWGDIYNADLPCQYVDVTGLAPGDYSLEIELDPLHQIPESNENNNLVRIPFVLTEACSGRPANDDFLSAEVLQGSLVTVLNDTTCATKQTGEPNHFSNAGSRASKSIWYRWTPTETGPVTLSTEGSAFDTVLAVYVGESLGTLAGNRIAEADDITDFVKQSRLTFNAIKSTRYAIAVDGINGGAGAQGGLVVFSINPSSNDNFDACASLTGAEGTTRGSIALATGEEGEPLHAAQPGGRSLWYCWTAPTSGLYTWETLGSSFDSLLAVYTGSDIAALTPVASDDDSGGKGTSRLQFPAVAGTEYKIAIDQKFGTNGTASTSVAELTWHAPGYLQAPIIMEQPHSIATFIGSNAVLSVSVKASPPLTYQWYHGGFPVVDGDNVSGAQTATLQIVPLKESDRGVYEVKVSNDQGTTNSVSVNVVAASRNRVVYVEPMYATPGTIVPVHFAVAAKGGEHSFHFSALYDPTKLFTPQVEAGADLPANSVLTSDLSLAAQGKIGITITLPPGATLPAGDAVLAVIQAFLAPGLAPEERVAVCFDDQPVTRLVAGLDATPLSAIYACGSLITQPRDVLSGHLLSDGTFQLNLQGVPGVTYEFQSSVDLVTWTTFSTQVNQNGAIVVIDPTPHPAGMAFYRTVRKPL